VVCGRQGGEKWRKKGGGGGGGKCGNKDVRGFLHICNSMKESEKKRKLFFQQQKDCTSVVRKYNKGASV